MFGNKTVFTNVLLTETDHILRHQKTKLFAKYNWQMLIPGDPFFSWCPIKTSFHKLSRPVSGLFQEISSIETFCEMLLRKQGDRCWWVFFQPKLPSQIVINTCWLILGTCRDLWDFLRAVIDKAGRLLLLVLVRAIVPLHISLGLGLTRRHQYSVRLVARCYWQSWVAAAAGES